MAIQELNYPLKERISYPILPYATSIPGGIFLEKTITIRGMLFDKDPYQLAIDLCCGRAVQGDHLDNKALHFNPRFIKKKGFFDRAQNALVLNSLIDNQWGIEIRFPNYFQANAPFTVRILVLEHYFSISLNEKHLLNYVHRIPYTNINTLFINGAAKIDSIEFDIFVSNPSNNSSFKDPQNLFIPDFIFRYPSIPFAHSFCPGLLNHRKEFILTATPAADTTVFNFNLKRNDDYFFHLRVDFPKKNFNGALVRNYCINRKWAIEEINNKFPFLQQKIFELKIKIEFDHLVANLDGQQIFTFNYRPGIYLNEVNMITIDGDLSISKIELKTCSA